MKKPESSRRFLAESCFYLLALCLPYYQSLFFAGICGSIYFLLMACLLVFVVIGSQAVFHVVTACLQALPLDWLPQATDRSFLYTFAPSRGGTSEPSLTPLFQRPPPLFS
ncbi:MAG: hypothetical protein WAN35_02995 [Terracidiphilus sp.]